MRYRSRSFGAVPSPFRSKRRHSRRLGAVSPAAIALCVVGALTVSTVDSPTVAGSASNLTPTMAGVSARGPRVTTGPAWRAANAQSSHRRPAAGAPASGCDPIDPTQCLLPYPDDFFTASDRSSPTGRRVAFPLSAMPRNAGGVPIDPTAFNRNDGFSPGTPVILHVNAIDLARSKVAPITDIGSSLNVGAPIVIIDARTGKRVPYWAELDANDPNPAEQALIIHAAADYRDGHRYIVALRNLVDASGQVIPPNAVFRAYRDGTAPPKSAQRRQAHMETLLNTLQSLGIERQSLYLAWDFTIASQQSLTGPMLHIRDDAFHQLAGGAPAFQVTGVTDYTTAQDPRIARHVSGTFSVPSYLDQPGGPPGSRFNLGTDGLPAQMPGNVQTANFECNIPRSVVADGSSTTATVYPGHAMLYGHGLLGSADEITDPVIESMANVGNFVTCGTDWLGLASQDIGTDATILTDFSQFPILPDRGQQGMLDFLFLGRLLTSPAGFVRNPAFAAGSGHPTIDTAAGLSYYGNSQGGIEGGALTAVSQEFTRAVLGVPGMDYSLLLNRSVDFDPFAAVLNGSYPNKLVQQIDLGLIQMLWDRSEADGYAQSMTGSPLPGTPAHQVLLEEAFGDHQVANIATETEARTIGAEIHQPALAAGRSPDTVPFYGIRPISSPGYGGSALFVWDSGTPAPPLTNTPNRAGADPHGVPRAQPDAQLQATIFLLQGAVTNPCGTAACQAVPSGG
jgi:hypothetical protein